MDGFSTGVAKEFFAAVADVLIASRFIGSSYARDL
jgi:hypothetical protein